MTDPFTLLDQYYDGTLTEEGAEVLRNYIKDNPSNAKKIMLAAYMHNNLGELLSGMGDLRDSDTPKASQQPLFPDAAEAGPVSPMPHQNCNNASFWRSKSLRYAGIAAILFIAAFSTLEFWPSQPKPAPIALPTPTYTDAILTSTINATWETSPIALRIGDRLPQQILQLRTGLAQITMPSGTCVVVAAPAEFSIDSSSQIQLKSGSLTSLVTPQGIGFTVLSPGCTVTDLGTEFGVYIDRNQQTHAEVFSGKVRVSAVGEGRESWIVTAGRAVQIASPGATLQDATPEPLAFVRPVQYDDIQSAQGEKNLARWAAFSQSLAQDDKTLAYYTFDKQSAQLTKLTNKSIPTSGKFDGTITGPAWDQGRFPGKQSLRFTGGNAGVHIDIPDRLPAFTIAGWINAESFGVASQEPHGNRFTALLLSDGVRESAVHWQIMDGRRLELGLSLGKDPTASASTSFQHYWSTDSLSADNLNQWTFVAVVVDPVAREVRHYCNGTLAGVSPLGDHPPALIGPANIGNWNPQLPRPDSVRGFIGRIDELALIARPLSDQEIQAMYSAGGGK